MWAALRTQLGALQARLRCPTAAPCILPAPPRPAPHPSAPFWGRSRGGAPASSGGPLAGTPCGSARTCSCLPGICGTVVRYSGTVHARVTSRMRAGPGRLPPAPNSATAWSSACQRRRVQQRPAGPALLWLAAAQQHRPAAHPALTRCRHGRAPRCGPSATARWRGAAPRAASRSPRRASGAAGRREAGRTLVNAKLDAPWPAGAQVQSNPAAAHPTAQTTPCWHAR